jgi:hypothetical protein
LAQLVTNADLIQETSGVGLLGHDAPRLITQNPNTSAC